MYTVSRVSELRRQIQQWRSNGDSIALVPTMGHLHEGHLQLVRIAKEKAARCVVSVFVNPMQFGQGEDFGSYPRTVEEDREKLLKVGADLLFTPSVAEVYPHGEGDQTRVEVPYLSDMLCGASRPGHFVGVATVVCKLFNMVQSDVAVFGEKDYQQLLVIRRMVMDLSIPVEIVGVPTVREVDGLARSSRNSYLNTQERELAPLLFATLQSTAAEILDGVDDYLALEAAAQQRLEGAGFQPDYFTVRHASDLAPPEPDDRELVILAAAFLGQARLIDNLTVTLKTMH